tara:strand:+ start:237 stop:755 length:519 start_codon:yes stop_codon:yes gene_type:complete
MNIFVTDESPVKCAQVLPDKHIVKMPLECCQMLSIVASDKWGQGYGTLPKTDGTPYATDKGAFRNHPCTIWANETAANARWLIRHGLALCEEYSNRYAKIHSCLNTLAYANRIFPLDAIHQSELTTFRRAMPDEWKFDDTIDTFTAYKRYIASKPWVKDNYLRIPDRKPDWI